MTPSAVDVESEDRRLLALVDAATGAAVARSGRYLACRPGCSECCVGPFPITPLDAWRLRRGLARLAAADPERARRVRARAQATADRLAGDYPGDTATGLLVPDDGVQDAFFARHERVACPVLDPATGRCDLYAERPISCRAFGPPMRIEGEDLPPCRLCFTTATDAEIDGARVSLECARDEAPLLDALAAATGDDGDTIVAFALTQN